MLLTLKTAMVLAAGLPPVTPGNGLPGISTVTGFLGGLGGAWFSGPGSPWATMRLIVAALGAPIIVVGVIQSVLRNNGAEMARRALLYPALAGAGTLAVISLTSILLNITDALSKAMLSSAGTDLATFGAKAVATRTPRPSSRSWSAWSPRPTLGFPTPWPTLGTWDTPGMPSPPGWPRRSPRPATATPGMPPPGKPFPSTLTLQQIG